MTTGSSVDHIRRRIRHAIPDHIVNTAHILPRRMRRHANICERNLQQRNDFGDNFCESVELFLTISAHGSKLLRVGHIARHDK